MPRLLSLAAALVLGAALAACSVTSTDRGAMLMLKPASPYAAPGGYAGDDNAKAAILFNP